MNERIKQLAEQAGDGWDHSLLEDVAIITLERFAALIAAAEREDCARVCDALASPVHWLTAQACAAAIRARGEA